MIDLLHAMTMPHAVIAHGKTWLAVFRVSHVLEGEFAGDLFIAVDAGVPPPAPCSLIFVPRPTAPKEP